MSDPAHTATADTTTRLSDWFHHNVVGIKHAASAVYHKILKIEADVTQWEQSDPQIAALLAEGVQIGTHYLQNLGVPVDAVRVAAHDLLVVLKGMAAQDATLPSVATASTGNPPTPA